MEILFRVVSTSSFTSREYNQDKLAERLRKYGMKRVDARGLRRYRQFYLIYPQIRELLTPESHAMLVPVESPVPKRESVSPAFKIDGKTILEKLSFSHLAELIKMDDPVKRAFYEVECIRGNWSVRELSGTDCATNGDRLFDEKVRTPSPQLGVPVEKLIHNLSYSHIELLVCYPNSNGL